MFMLKYFPFFFISGAVVMCSEGLQMHVDYTCHTHNISDSSENTGQSLNFLETPNEKKVDADVLFCENILLRHIILECVR